MLYMMVCEICVNVGDVCEFRMCLTLNVECEWLYVLFVDFVDCG